MSRLITCCLLALGLSAAETPTVTAADRLGPDGIVYADFSHAGRPGGIPAVPVVVQASDFGAVPDDDQDDAAGIQAAIDAAVKKGGGAVLLAPGDYVIDRTLLIAHDGIVLRGADRQRTRLVPRFAGQDVSKTNASQAVIAIEAPKVQRRYDVWPDRPVQRGDTVLHLSAKDATRVQVGDLVTFTAMPPAEAIALLSPDLQKQTRDGSYGSIYAWQYVEILAIDGTTVTVNQPLRLDVAMDQKPKLMHVPVLVTDCGVEDLTIAQTVDSQGINGVSLNGTRGCWVRGVTVQKIGNWPFHVGRSWQFIVRDCAFDESLSRGGAVAYIGFGFACDGLIENSSFTRLRHLSISMASNGLVFRDCTLANIDINFHLNWPYEVLFETCTVDSGAAPDDEMRGSYGNAIYTPRRDGDMHCPAGPNLTFYGNDFISPSDGIMLGGGATQDTVVVYNRFQVRQGFAAVIRPGSDGTRIHHNTFVLHAPEQRKRWNMQQHYGHQDPESVSGAVFFPQGVPPDLAFTANTIHVPRPLPLFAGGEPADVTGTTLHPAITTSERIERIALAGEWRAQAVDLRPAAATPAVKNADPGTSAAAQNLLALTVNDAAWPVLDIPAEFAADPVDFKRHDGEAVLRRQFDLPADLLGKDLVLSLGTIDDHDETWVNGQRVGATEGNNSHRVARQYDIPRDLLRPTGNVVAVRIWDSFGGGGMTGAQRDLWIGVAPVEVTLEAGERPTPPVPSLYDWQVKQAAATGR